MSENTNKNRAEIKKNVLYALWIVLLVAVMAASVIVVAKISESRRNELNDGNDGIKDSQTVIDGENSGDSGDSDNSSIKDPVADEPIDDLANQQPTVTKITFIMPVKNASVLKKYTHNTVVFNSTLGAYMGHMGIDYKAEEGTDFYCVYDGVVESIETSYLTGTTITVNHGNNLKTVYNSVEADEKLYEGKAVLKGEILGKVTANNLQEYKDGAHLHFEVEKSGEKVDPEEYLIGEEK